MIDTLSRASWVRDELSVLVSTPVHENLATMGSELDAFELYQVIDMFGLRTAFTRPPVDPGVFDAVLNIFGPVYSAWLARHSVMGFAQPWIAFPHNDAYRTLSSGQRLRTRTRSAIQAMFFRLADCLVVEQEPVRQALLGHALLGKMPIEVVSNTVDSIFLQPQRWEEVRLPPASAQHRLGLVSRAYPHKNLPVLAEVSQLLRQVHELSVEILVTLTDAEWHSQSAAFRKELVNVGALRLSQAPSFISQLDGVVFPTLLECFSAVPLEARTLGVPLFASDLPVIRATVQDYAAYFDPTRPEDIAATIAGHFRSAEPPRSGDTHTLPPQAPSDSAEMRARQLLDLCHVQGKALRR